MSIAEIVERLSMHSIRNRMWYIQATCAVSGDGLYEGCDWITISYRNLRKKKWINSKIFHTLPSPPKNFSFQKIYIENKYIDANKGHDLKRTHVVYTKDNLVRNISE